jgi:hypothetical protein
MVKQESRNGALNNGQQFSERLGIDGEQEAQGKRKGQHPLSDRCLGKYVAVILALALIADVGPCCIITDLRIRGSLVLREPCIGGPTGECSAAHNETQ